LSLVVVMVTILVSSWWIMIYAEPALQAALRRRLLPSGTAKRTAAEAAPRT
jgi:hypothetical protein